MEILMPDNLWTLLLIGVTFSVFLMALVQKIKTLDFINKSWEVWLINLICSFAMGIPFGMMFYQLDIKDAIWVSLFGFIGAPSIYEALKSQNIITYKPKSCHENSKCIPKENEIKRTDLN